MVACNKILFYGGTNGAIPFFDDILLFDIATAKWRSVDLEKLKTKLTNGPGSDKRQRIQSACTVNSADGEDS